MIKLILSALVVAGTAFILVWKRYGTSEARKEKLLEELAEIIDKMDKFPADGDYALYHKLQNRRLQINKRISRLNRR